jgi:hypothetical protein
MNDVIDRIVHPNLLWHSGPSENRERILSEGLRPRGPTRAYQPRRPVRFYKFTQRLLQSERERGGS